MTENLYGLTTDDCRTRYESIWFGVRARVTIGPGFLHRAGFGGFAIPHPPLANWLLRLGMPEAARRSLTFAHEFAHFRTAPVLFVYMLILAAIFHGTGNTGIGEILLVISGGQAAWEMMSESLVMLENSAAYREAYAKKKSIPRILFWTASSLAAIVLPILAIFLRLR